MVVLHELAGRLFVHLGGSLSGPFSTSVTAGAVAGRDENLVVPDDRRRDHGHAAREIPIAIAGGHRPVRCPRAVFNELHVLRLAVDSARRIDE